MLPNVVYVGRGAWREGVNGSITLAGDGYLFKAIVASDGAILAAHRDRRPRDRGQR